MKKKTTEGLGEKVLNRPQIIAINPIEFNPITIHLSLTLKEPAIKNEPTPPTHTKIATLISKRLSFQPDRLAIRLSGNKFFLCWVPRDWLVEID